MCSDFDFRKLLTNSSIVSSTYILLYSHRLAMSEFCLRESMKFSFCLRWLSKSFSNFSSWPKYVCSPVTTTGMPAPHALANFSTP